VSNIYNMTPAENMSALQS